MTKEPARHSLQRCSSLVARTTGRRPALAAQRLRGACWIPGTPQRAGARQHRHRTFTYGTAQNRGTGFCLPNVSCGQLPQDPQPCCKAWRRLSWTQWRQLAPEQGHPVLPRPLCSRPAAGSTLQLAAPCNWQHPATGSTLQLAAPCSRLAVRGGGSSRPLRCGKRSRSRLSVGGVCAASGPLEPHGSRLLHSGVRGRSSPSMLRTRGSGAARELRSCDSSRLLHRGVRGRGCFGMLEL